MDDLHNHLLAELECPICMNHMSPPIKQCITGHNICGDCRKKMSACPLCQSVFTESRNMSLEALSQKILFPCTNHPFGCSAKLKFNNRIAHDKKCPFKPYECALETCKWTGKCEDIVKHWISKQDRRMYHSPYTCYLKIKPNFYFANMAFVYDQPFWLKIHIRNNKIYWVVQFIGSAEKASSYHYEIELFVTEQPKCKLIMSDYCRDINIDKTNLFNDEYCVSAGIDSVTRFINQERILHYYLRIFSDEKSPENAETSQKTHKPYKKNEGSKSVQKPNVKKEFRASCSDISKESSKKTGNN